MRPPNLDIPPVELLDAIVRELEFHDMCNLRDNMQDCREVILRRISSK
jgi:hypothetical protein